MHPTSTLPCRSSLAAAALAAALLAIGPRGARAEVPAVSDTAVSAVGHGIAIHAREDPGKRMQLRFYEANLFRAVTPRIYSPGSFERRILANGPDRVEIENTASGARLVATASRRGAELRLRIANRSDREWYRLASILPCFTPGRRSGKSVAFVNRNTYYHGPRGLAPLKLDRLREAHYDRALRAVVDRIAAFRRLPWEHKWPTSRVDATRGLIARVSTDGEWVTGVAWESFLFAQGHNSWHCMHLPIHLGALAAGETRTVRGKLYLFRGTAEELLAQYYADFGPPPGGAARRAGAAR